MSDLLLYRRTLDGFVPFSDEANDYFSKIKLGEVCELKGKHIRNGKYHRLFFVMLQLISQNSNPHISTKAAKHFAKVATGTGEVVTDSRGNNHFVPEAYHLLKWAKKILRHLCKPRFQP